MPQPSTEALSTPLIKPSLERVAFMNGMTLTGQFTFDQLHSIRHATDIAERAHELKTRDDGQPYMRQHIFPVVVDVFQNTEWARDVLIEQRLVLVILALLHDVAEDAPHLFEIINTDYVCSEILDMVLLLKRDKVEEAQLGKFHAKVAYLSRVASNPYALLVKFADQANNLECTDAGTPKARRYAIEALLLYIPLALKYPEISGSYLDRIWRQVQRLLPYDDLDSLTTNDYYQALELEERAKTGLANSTNR